MPARLGESAAPWSAFDSRHWRRLCAFQSSWKPNRRLVWSDRREKHQSGRHGEMFRLRLRSWPETAPPSVCGSPISGNADESANYFFIGRRWSGQKFAVLFESAVGTSARLVSYHDASDRDATDGSRTWRHKVKRIDIADDRECKMVSLARQRRSGVSENRRLLVFFGYGKPDDKRT